VLPTAASDLALWEMTERVPSSWRIAVTLVRDCVESPAWTGPGSADPCGWRQSWYYRVQPDGAVTLLYDAGDPAGR
jgi:hypothetical protein